MSSIETQVRKLSEFKDEIVPGAVKAAMSTAGAKSSDLWRVPRASILVRADYNPRVRTPDYEAYLDALAQSIANNGFYDDKALSVSVVSEGGENLIYIEDGHGRFEATGIAVSKYGAVIDTLPVIPLPRSMSAEQRLVHMVHSNNDGRKFYPLELAIIVQRLGAFGHDEKKIADELGMTTNYVKQLQLLAASPKIIRDMVKGGEISATLAIETLQEHKEEAAALLTEAKGEAVKAGKKLTGKQVKKTAEKKKKPGVKELAAKSERAQKKHGVEAFDLLRRIMDKHGKLIDNEFHSEVDALFFRCGVI